MQDRSGNRPATAAVEDEAAGKECTDHIEDLLDEALEESFPASDPPSIAQPPTKQGC